MPERWPMFDDYLGDDRELTYRSYMLPLGTYRNKDGSQSAGLAWPQMLLDAKDAAETPGELLFGNGLTREEAERRAIIASGLMMGGGLVAPRPGNALGLVAEAAPHRGVTFPSRNASIFDAPNKPARPFEWDYPGVARSDDSGRLTHDIDGRPLTAKYVAGRRTLGGMDEAIPPAELDALSASLFGSPPDYVTSRALHSGDVGRYRNMAGPDGPERDISVLGSLPQPVRERVLAHEVGHGIDDLAGFRYGIPDDGLKRQVGGVYNTLNNPNRSRDGLEAATWGKSARPQDFGYRGDDIRAEHMAEAIRAYMTDPNYLKSVAPETAKRIREHVNGNARLSREIQFNAGSPDLSPLSLYLGRQSPEDDHPLYRTY